MDTTPAQPQRRRVLIVSHHPLFGEGLRRLFAGAEVPAEVIAVVESLEEAQAVDAEQQPDIIVIDYDDAQIALERCLVYLAQGRRDLRVVLLSLQMGGEAVVFDRRVVPAGTVEEEVARLLG